MNVLVISTVKTFTNITNDVRNLIPEGFNGLVNVFSKHTTCGIRILEDEILLKADYCNFLESVAPKDGKYQHDNIGVRDVPVHERVNGHSHIRTLFFPTSETIPITEGKMLLGKWQSIFLVELDPVRDREVVVSLLSNPIDL